MYNTHSNSAADIKTDEETPTATQVADDSWVVHGLFGALTLVCSASSLGLYEVGVMSLPEAPPARETAALAVPPVHTYTSLSVVFCEDPFVDATVVSSLTAKDIIGGQTARH